MAPILFYLFAHTLLLLGDGFGLVGNNAIQAPATQCYALGEGLLETAIRSERFQYRFAVSLPTLFGLEVRHDWPEAQDTVFGGVAADVEFALRRLRSGSVLLEPSDLFLPVRH